MRLTNVGSYPVIDTKMLTLREQDSAAALLSSTPQFIARGLGNSIGDCALNKDLVVSTIGLDKILAFDNESGILIVESGVILADIARSFAPFGWFLPTTPGTNRVSIGGAVAADVHGKNHHVAGSFDDHVLWIDVLTAEQGIVQCSPQQNADLFHATCGGHGLTGVILTVAVQMVRIPSMWIKQTGIKTNNLTETLEACAAYAGSPYTVAWIDSRAKGKDLGRGYLMCGDFAEQDELSEQKRVRPNGKRHGSSFKIPLYFPVPLLDLRLWTQGVNAVYSMRAPKGVTHSLVSIDSFFYPLETVDLRMFGGGHITYQFVLPYSTGKEGFSVIFDKIVKSGLGSLISVLKLFGPQKKYPGNISFPMEGYNLGIDFKVSDKMFALFRELDAMVLDYGGRHYLTKDVCLSPESIRRGYGKSLDEFLEVKAKWDPKNRFRSCQSMRLKLY